MKPLTNSTLTLRGKPQSTHVISQASVTSSLGFSALLHCEEKYETE